MKDCATIEIKTPVVPNTRVPTLEGFINSNEELSASVFTDQASACGGLFLYFDHESVCHHDGEYVRGEVHTNGIESLWSMLKRVHKGTYHRMSPKHLKYEELVA